MLCTLLSVAGLWAQNTPVQITGSVLFTQEELPAPGYPVWVTNAEGIEFGGMTDDTMRKIRETLGMKLEEPAKP